MFAPVRRHSAFALASALALSPLHPAAQTTASVPHAARPIPPRLALRITGARCSYGGAVPAISVEFDVSSPVALTGLHASSLMIGSASTGWSLANTGPLTTREWTGGAPGTPSARAVPFAGALAAGATAHLQVFAQLHTAAFGGGVTYPDRELAWRLVLDAAQGVYELSGPACTITPAG